MKVKDLLEKLKTLDPEMEVILQKDAAGNGFSPLAGADPDCIYVAHTTWSGDVYGADESYDEYEDFMDEEEWKEMIQKPRALVLYPVN